MISKLPRWVWFGAWILAFIAGMINVVTLLSAERQAVSHLTGNTSMLANALASLDGTAIIHFVATIGSFVAGTTLSAFIIRDQPLQLGLRYGIAFFLEAVLLFCAALLLAHHNHYGIYAAASACGLQNAMASTYSGTVVRTTHVSGMFTDLGVFLGHALRRLPVDARRLRLCCLVISGFLCGGIAGASTYRFMGSNTLFIPAAFIAVTSVSYIVFRPRGANINFSSKK